MAVKGLEPRKLAYLAIRASESKSLEASLTGLLDSSDLTTKDKALSYAICMAVFRNLIKIDRIIDRFLKSPNIDIEVREILRIGIAQSHFLSRIPPHAIVSTSVELTKLAGKTSASGLINAVLRKIIGAGLIDFNGKDETDKISLETSHPRWLIERWAEAHDIEFVKALAEANNAEPPFTIRVNSRKITVDDLQERFELEGIRAEIDERTPEYIYLDRRNPRDLPGWNDGLFSVQDPAFGIPVWLLAPYPKEKILEIGCAPGGKLSHLAEIAGGDIELHGLDISDSRIDLTNENLERLGHKGDVELHAVDAREFDMKDYFDAILLDAPCTSLGVIRRHPEIRYRRKPEDIDRMSEIQRELIEAAVTLLNPDGRLIYCSCSTQPEEGEAHFENLPKGFSLSKIVSGIPTEFIQGNFVRTWPHRDNLDGSFCAVISRD